jgi:hypothetical protein
MTESTDENSDRWNLVKRQLAGQASTGGKQIPLDQMIASLKDMQRTQFTKETEFLFEKSQMT